jgi:2Fe-2S ferredoxin
METAVRNGVPGIVAECGGSLSCATCHVFVREDCLSKLPPMEDMEDEMLYGTAVDREDNSRLSCQLRLTDELDLFVTTPETQV